MIKFYKDKYFNQWSHWEFVVDGVKYWCSEQFMMAKKAKLFKDKNTLRCIMNTNDPSTMRKLGRLVKGYQQEVWDIYKWGFVIQGNFAKFSQNEEIKKILLDTGNELIVEASPVDYIWGEGADGSGQNLLGKALIVVRSMLQ